MTTSNYKITQQVIEDFAPIVKEWNLELKELDNRILDLITTKKN